MHNNEWRSSIVDVGAELAIRVNARAYWRKLKRRLKQEGGKVMIFCHTLKLLAPDGKPRKTGCFQNTEGMFRIVPSILSTTGRLATATRLKGKEA